MYANSSVSPPNQNFTNDLSWLELFKKARELYQKGILGDKDATQQSYRLLEQLTRKVPENNLVQAYYGSAICLLGRDQTDSLERSASVIRGLKIMDQAVVQESDNFEIRVIRGNVCVNLPEMYFHRNATAVEDCKYVISCYEQYPESIPAAIYFQFLYNLSIAYRNLGRNELADSVITKFCRKAKDPKYKQLLAPKEKPEYEYGTESFYIIFQPLPLILEEGEKLHQAALHGGKLEIGKAIDFFAKAQVLHPEDQLLKAYHADCMSLKAKYATNTGEMFANAMKAMKEIDSAVVKEPDNLRLRLIRANHSLRLPEMFFGRTATAVNDLEYLAERIENDPALISKKETEAILFNLGLCYYRLGLTHEGEKVWCDLAQVCTGDIKDKITFHQDNQLSPEVDSGLSLTKNPTQFYATAKRLHYQGVSGNQAAAKRALEMWQKAYTEKPTDPVAEGFYGSSLALVGKESNEINLMFGNAIKGLRHVSAALERDPDNRELRLIRAYLAYSLPEVFFHTTQQAIQDFEYLINVYQHEQGSNHDCFTKELYDQVRVDLQKAKSRME